MIGLRATFGVPVMNETNSLLSKLRKHLPGKADEIQSAERSGGRDSQTIHIRMATSASAATAGNSSSAPPVAATSATAAMSCSVISQ